MKNNQVTYRSLVFFLTLIVFLISNVVMAQTDSLQVAQDSKKEEKKEKKKKNAFIVYAGVSFNNLGGPSEKYESSLAPGYLLGFSYKQGRFFYWQIGARYNHAIFSLTDSKINEPDATDTDASFSVSELDIPITVGINILSVTSRIVGLRVFVSAIPAFALGVGSNDLGIGKDDINTFNLYGQAGVGVDVTFIVIETGFNYGFVDLFQNDIPSNPAQIWLKLGFRF